MFYLGLILLKFIGFFLSLLPRWVFLRAGSGLGCLLLWAGFRTKIAEDNISLAFPDFSPHERAELLNKNYAHMGIVFLEFLRSFYRFQDFIRKYVHFVNPELIREAGQDGKGILVMTAHVGNWEALCGGGSVIEGLKILMVTKKLKPEWFHRCVEITRELMGIKMAVEPQTMRLVKRALQKGDLVGFVMDQYAGAPVGARIAFFGVPTGSHTALAKLSMRYNRRVLPAIAVRDANGNYTIRFDPALPILQGATVEESVLLNTRAQVEHTEKWVREFPEQWLWVHKRWKGDRSPLPENVIGEVLRD